MKLILVCGLVLAMVGRAGAQEGTDYSFPDPWGKAKKGQPAPVIACWLPKDVARVRSVVVAHPMIKELATGARFRQVAAEEGLGLMVFGGFSYSGKETMARLDQVFDQWAEASKHPEIHGAAVFTGGLSASVLQSRNVAYAASDRCFGTLHVAGGNLHQNIVDERKSLVGVPFIAMNGEYESCGPEGGIRPHLGFDTQWYLMGDTMLARRRDDPNNLMSLVVVPGKGHTAWNQELAALFLRKAAQYRLGKDGKCGTLKAESGWLTDRNVKYPQHEPAAYNDYQGDKSQAFWHFDKEMALAVTQYHKDGIRPGQERSMFRPAGTFEKLWPLGETINAALTGSVEVACEYVTQKTGKPALAAAIAAAPRTDEVTTRKMCLRICYAYDDWFVPLSESKEYAELALVDWPAGKNLPTVPLRQLGQKGPVFPVTPRPEGLDKLLEELASKDAKVGWAAAEAIAKLGPGPLPDLVRLMDFAPSPANFRAAAALGQMGRGAAPALPDLRRTAARGGTTEDESLLSRKALEAIERIEQAVKEAK